ncbi:hypothetical protein CTI12_AA405050 [Artemisia annua]|uniref:Retrotransposon gag domain-containing protein n=1 Tax=Artemisia annua TaxID=35608 RepID=A0A2U1M9W9_ARTAN|nr:hypothetical protein CTI12_AA405050 [Artemisia annua]
MSGENSTQTPTQEAMNNQGDPDIEPTPIVHDAGGPSDPTLEPDAEYPVMQFVVHKFDRMKAMYKAFTQKLKDTTNQRVFTNIDPPVIEPWNSDSDELHPGNAKENAFVESDNNDPSKSRAAIGGTPLKNTAKERPVLNNDFYHEPFVFKEVEKDVRDLVASPFSKRIRDYDMPDEPAWCRFFQIRLSGEARFWYDNLTPGSIDGFYQLRDKLRANFLQQRRFQKTQAEILGIRQRPEESLKDYVARFSKETLHMADHSDAMVSGAFISGLRPGRLFKDLIAKPPTSLEDLFTQTHNFIQAEDTNNETRPREPRRETKQHMMYKDLPRRTKDKHVSRPATRQGESHRFPHETFTALIKSPAEILATSEGREIL